MDNSHLPGHIGINTLIVEGTLRVFDDDLMKIIPAIYKKTPETPSLNQPRLDELLSQLKTLTHPHVNSGNSINLTGAIEDAAHDDSVADDIIVVSPTPSIRSPPKTVFETHFTVMVPTADNVTPSWNGQPDNPETGCLLFNLRAHAIATQRTLMDDNPALLPPLSTTTAADPTPARPKLPYLQGGFFAGSGLRYLSRWSEK